MMCARPSVILPYIDEWLGRNSLNELPNSVIRRIYDIRKGKTQWVTYKAVDNIFTAMTRPDWFALIDFEEVNYNAGVSHDATPDQTPHVLVRRG